MNVPTLILIIATILQGEAGVLGRLGMVAVADTMLTRSQVYECRLDECDWHCWYFAADSPSPEAIEVATMMVEQPWEPTGYLYVYSEQDRERMGWPEGDLVIRRGRWTLHLARGWPGGE